MLEAEKRNLAPLRLRHQGLHPVDDRDGDRDHRGQGAGERHCPASSTPAATCCPTRSRRCRTSGRRWRRSPESYLLVMITKGDLFDQERKLAQSGLGDFFHAVEIVSDKTAVTYRRIFSKVGGGPERAMMVGNSLKSDIVPAIAAGSYGVFVPHELTWVRRACRGTEGRAALSQDRTSRRIARPDRGPRLISRHCLAGKSGDRRLRLSASRAVGGRRRCLRARRECCRARRDRGAARPSNSKAAAARSVLSFTVML